MEKYDMNLRQLLQLTEDTGMPLGFVKGVAKKFAHFLKVFEELNLTHGDIRPENIVARIG